MEDFKTLKAEVEKVYVPLSKEAYLSYWNASLTGKAEDWAKYEALDKKINAFFSDKATFARVKSIRDAGAVTDPVAKRDLETIYLSYLGYQVDTAKLDAISSMSTQIEKQFNNFRAEVKGKKLTDNDVLSILKESNDSEERKGVWMAQKKIGAVVADDLRKLVKMRNGVAIELGFKNYHDMSLRLSEQDPETILQLFDKLDTLTKDDFAEQKKELDACLCKRFKVKPEEIMPWHYHDLFFQEAPKIYSVDYDTFYKGKNLEQLTESFYKSLGMDISSILHNSDLYQREGKSQHAYCLTIDRLGDTRVLSNNVDNDRWMSTMLHEFGHSVYDKYIDQTLPFFLRTPAHIFTTEAVAMMFERLSHKSHWIGAAVGISPEKAKEVDSTSPKTFVLNQLVFSRWTQVMFRFEKSLYEKPDQDLSKLWWEMVEKYQGLRKPEGRTEPDWASKIHIATSPCYYHNYLLGELLASQLNHYIATNILHTEDVLAMPYYGQKEVGEFLKKKVFGPGRLCLWNEMIKGATGEELTAKHYARELELCMGKK